MVAVIIITCIYSALIISFIVGYDRVNLFSIKEPSNESRFSIVIPFRNEAPQLPILLNSLSDLSYPEEKYELIFVDDESEDASVTIIQDFLVNSSQNFKILSNERVTKSPKKDAINVAIKEASFNWIITTDADCILPKKWLQSFDQFVQHKTPKLIVGPVTYLSKNSFIERFQHLDFLSLMGSTIGGFGIGKPFLCNGANLCYHKDTFLEVGGFKGNSGIASGDDIFLLEKINKKYPNDVHYLKSKDATVRTKPQPTFKQLLHQRTRWAAKSTTYKNVFSQFVSLVVLAMNLLLILLCIGAVFSINSWYLLAIIFCLKFCVDILLLYKTCVFFDQRIILKHFLLSSLVYPLFIMFVIINSLKSGYSWKGRAFKK